MCHLDAVRRMSGPTVVAAAPRHADAAHGVAMRLGAVLLDREAWSAQDPPRVVLWVDDEGLGLRGPPAGASPRRSPQPPTTRRSGREGLLRALGGPPSRVSVIDATAGWGADAGVIAAAGARVTMIERSEVVAAILEDALARWRSAGIEASTRMHLVRGEARALLESGAHRADVVYLDPFYAGQGDALTTAADLRWLRVAARWGDASGEAPDPDSDALLLRAARAAADRRVVVKRPIAAEPLAGVAPSGSLRGRTTRFDLYAPLRGHGVGDP
jgi:16S rRNA (guanine1516-N2)-methyltransferase